ncbi:hypothetical protein B0T16DRAFT_419999 [Cercophora newfieldiana]|uniref:Atos-like conserved domain-containing protein n=1 Tax=Cercophora newfieldiana TaxID=92897 RepID=A0AA39XWS0_9PEZI|nr:hypothetical protein B0T16DRAFT_419999 [Cercophora newfieldiana]
MPMIQENFGPKDSAGDEPDGHSNPTSTSTQPLEEEDLHQSLRRRVSEESIRTELCEGPIPDSPPKAATPEKDAGNAVSDRAELIERLKRGESPTWVPNRHLESLFHQNKLTSSPPRTPQRPSSTSPGLLPAPTITPEKADSNVDDAGAEARLQDGLTIERPRSALHSGNFTPEESSPHHDRDAQNDDPLDRTVNEFGPGTAPWMATSPPRHFTPFNFGRATADYRREAFNPSGASSLSSSFSSSFVYKPPTSPLVQSESNDDVDLSLPLNSINIATSTPRNPRRHTLNFNFSHSSPYGNAAGERRPGHRREGVYPYQAHQPRRSLNSTPNFSFAGTSPQTPAVLRSRRPSFSSEASPLQHASMVGSYEESILRGRMSTTPSKPLEFMAQIGVLGLGKCKPNLRCPSHVTLPFSAVFYSYSTTAHGRSGTEDGPSPYVGQIDLENGLPNPDEGQRTKRKLQARYPELRAADEDSTIQNHTELSEGEARRRSRSKKRSKSPKAPPGGRYRIPEKGQLQIIIKNQNKTAVKLFLVPYDLAGMEPGTKTFIRQRSYSAGPIIDNIPEIKDASNEERPVLRYLIHLHICCPSKGRFYLYKSIRVVFANRVPDGKLRLRNEITYPEPRFTPYKPVRVMHPQPSGPAATLAAEKAFRRRSSGFSFAQYPQPFDALEGMPPSFSMAGLPSFSTNASRAPSAPADRIPFSLPQAQIPPIASNNKEDPSRQQEESRTASPQHDQMSGLVMTGQADCQSRYDKLSKGDVGYGGNAFVLGTNSGAVHESLLSKRLRLLGVQTDLDHSADEPSVGEEGGAPF